MKLRAFAALLLAPALIAAAPVPAETARGVDAALDRAYGPYVREENPRSDWNRPAFTTTTRRLIAAWQKHVDGNLTPMGSYGWFCECQDFDRKAFRWQRTALKAIGPGRAEARVRVTFAKHSSFTQRVILVREGARWAIDDLYAENLTRGLKSALRTELSEPPEY